MRRGVGVSVGVGFGAGTGGGTRWGDVERSRAGREGIGGGKGGARDCVVVLEGGRRKDAVAGVGKRGGSRNAVAGVGEG